MSLAASRPCRLQQYTALESSASKLVSDHGNTVQNNCFMLGTATWKRLTGRVGGRLARSSLTLVTQAPRSFEISGPFVDSVHSIGHNIYTRKPTPRALLVIHNRRFCDWRGCQTYDMRYGPTACRFWRVNAAQGRENRHTAAAPSQETEGTTGHI